MLEGLKYLNASEQKLLKEIFKYTSGQPYLTQTLCMQVFRYPCIPDEKLVVAGLVDTLFLDGEYPDDHLSSIDERIWRNKHCRLRMLHIYQALFNQHRIKSNPADPAQIYLKLSGLVVESNGFLRIANLIYEKYFNHDWVTHKLNCLERPFAKELQRWIDSGKKGDTALQGDQLQKAIAWKEERDDLSKLERDFIEFSSHVTYRKRSAIYRLERLQNRILRSFVIMISLFVISLLMGVVLYRGYASRDNNDVRLQKAEDNADQLIQDLEKVRKDLEKSQSSLDSLHHVFQDSLITLQRKLQKSNVTQQRYQRQATWLKSQLHSVQNDTVAIINYLRRLKGSLTPPDTTGTIHRKDTLSTSLSRKTAHK